MNKRLVFAIVAGAALGAASHAQQRTFELDDLARVVRVSDPQIAPDGKSVAILVARANLDNNRWDSEIALVDVAKGTVRDLTTDRRGVGSPRWSPSGDRLAFVAKVGSGEDAQSQIFILTLGGGDPKRITNAPKGVQQFAWSPDGATIAFTTADEPPKKSGREKFNDAFEAGNDDFTVTEATTPTHVWLVPAAGGEARRLTSGTWTLPVSFPPGPPSSPIVWAPDGKTLAIAKVVSTHSGDSYLSAIVLVDAASGALRPLTATGKYETFPAFSPDGTQVSYWFNRDGDPNSLNEAYVAPAAGGMPRSLTRTLDRFVFRSLWMPDGRTMLVGANDITRTSLWLQPLAGAPRHIDIGELSVANPFLVDVTVGPNGSIAFVGSDPHRPAELYFMASPAERPRRLTNLNAAVAALDLGQVETIEWQSDGLTHGGVLTYPPAYTSGQKYPLLLVIHGGPQSASLLNFSAQAQLMAAKGWIVFQPNYRGSDYRGNAYMHAIVGDMGEGPGRDVMAGVAAVKRRGFVDDSRVAVTGWSYGGYMTTWLIGHYSGWRAAMAGAPVTDFLDQYNFSDGAGPAWGDVFGGSPWTGTRMEAYRAQSPITYASNIKTPTLIMSDTGDVRVPPTQAFKLYHALQDNGVETKLVLFPVSGHNPADPIRQREVQRRWIEWVEQHFADIRARSH
jgi:dipeptidyl aminopeptidase/acylaminoacyl peptidase